MDKKTISNKFNDYFLNIGRPKVEQIPNSGPSFEQYLWVDNTEFGFLTSWDEQEIRQFTLHMRNSAPGHDEITSKVINHIIDILAPTLTSITNISFTEGVFPSELKFAQVMPLYKNNEPMLFNNYPPMSL